MRADRRALSRYAGLLGSVDAVLYDFDGVLVDSEPYFFLSNDAAFRQFGHSLDRREYWRHWTNEGTGPDGEIRRHGLKLTDGDRLELRRRAAEGYAAHIRSGRIRFIRDTVETVGLFRRSGRKVMIASNSRPEHLRLLFRIHGRRRDIPIQGRSGGMKPKPAPDIFLAAAARLGVAPERCLVVEDALKGLRAATSAGMPCVILRTPQNRGIGFGRADLVFGSRASFLRSTRSSLAAAGGRR